MFRRIIFTKKWPLKGATHIARSPTITIRVNSLINHYPIFSENAAGKKTQHSSKLRKEKHRAWNILLRTATFAINVSCLFTYYEMSTVCLHVSCLFTCFNLVSAIKKNICYKIIENINIKSIWRKEIFLAWKFK